MGKTRDTGFLTDCVFTDSSNNVGIGAAASGSYKFQVTGTTNLTGALTGTTGSFSVSVGNSNTGLDLTNSGALGYGNSINFYQNATKAVQIFTESSAANTSEIEFRTLVGGTLAKRFKIEATGAATFSSTLQVNSYQIINGASAGFTFLQFNNNGTPIGYTGSAAAIVTGGSASDYALATAQNIVFGTGGSFTEKMRITSGGTLLVNATSSTYGAASGYNFGVKGTSGQAFISIARTGQSLDSQGMILGLDTAAGQLTMIDNLPLTFATNNAERMRITSGGYLKASPNGSYFSSTALFSEFGNNTTNTPALFLTQTNTSFTDNVLFIEGYTNTTNNTWYLISGYNRTAGAYKFRVADSGNVTNTNNSYGAISDIKLKENIVDASPKLNDLLKVKIKNFNYIGSEEKQLGVIAQELEEVFPSMIEVHNDKDGEGNDLGTTTKSVKYSVFVPMLIKAIQEQQAQIEELSNKIVALESK